MKQKNNLIMLLAIVGFLILNACSGFVTQSHLKLAKGTTLATFKKIGVDYDKGFLLEKMNIKKQGKFEVYMTEIPGAFRKEVYYYAFRNDSLLFWGHPFQFNRHQNPIIKEIGETSMEYAAKEYGLDDDQVKK